METITTEHSSSVNVRDGMDWGVFFWRETATTDSDGEVRHGATFAAVTSFGTFGHHWINAGKPFAQFSADISPDYLLGKISRRETCAVKFPKEMRRAIFTARAPKEDKLRASRAFRELEYDYSGKFLAHAAYLSDEVNAVPIEWIDIGGEDYPIDARMFVEKLWPKFVAELAKTSD